MNPYPLYYCPPGVKPPAHCPFHAGMTMRANASPDGKEGQLYAFSSDLPTGVEWTKTEDGWWFLMGNQRPQDLMRMNPSPRITRCLALPGIENGQAWRVPVLLTPMDPANPDLGYVSALDRIWRGGSYGTPQDLLDCQTGLMHVAMCVALRDDLTERNAALVALVVKILSLTHFVSRHEIIHNGWLSEQLIAEVPLLAIDRLDLFLADRKPQVEA